MDIDERFAFLTAADGTKIQVLRFGIGEDGQPLHDEAGQLVPVDWDEAATAAAFDLYETERKAKIGFFGKMLGRS